MASINKYNVYAMGNALVDIEVLVAPDFLTKMGIEKGVMSLCSRERQSEILDAVRELDITKCCGGSAANTVIGVSELGGRCFYSCRVGGDKLGLFYYDDLIKSGVATNLTADIEKATTGTCVVMVTPDADRTMNTHLGISREFSKGQLILEEIKKSEYFYVEGYLLYEREGVDATLKGLEIARANGVKTALTLSDKNLVHFRRNELMNVIGDGVDLIFCNLDEACAFSNAQNVNECVEFLKKFAKTFAITLGDNGAIVYDGHNEIKVETEPVDAIDTLGAGDLFAGSFLYAITNDHPFDVAGKFACKCASTLCTKYGTRLSADDLIKIKKEIL